MNIVGQHFALMRRQQAHNLLIRLSRQLGRRMTQQFFVTLRRLRSGNALRVVLKSLEVIAIVRLALLRQMYTHALPPDCSLSQPMLEIE